ncbi:response regulator [Massilia sp. IC2-477]|uniref:response regulator n=1 Tax=unclassified Massilia TaxID=2609279 RepID=UPI001D11CA1C|nr:MULTISPECIES: response regulator [unclassified Massilia]MCC2956597.1 response regulator [Massilia sp. IC2-477]MCC2971171.1 response regulator [Massilia sp. IC2-476]
MHKPGAFNLLLVEPANLLRRTVSLTLRDLGAADVTETATYPTAHQMCELRRFDGLVIALEWPEPSDALRGLTLIQQIRSGKGACPATIPIAVLVESANAELIQVLRSCGVSRILIKPFRVRDVIETVENMKGLARAVATS